MPVDPDNDPSTPPRPWWAGSSPSWKSPWGMDEEEEQAVEAPQADRMPTTERRQVFAGPVPPRVVEATSQDPVVVPKAQSGAGTERVGGAGEVEVAVKVQPEIEEVRAAWGAVEAAREGGPRQVEEAGEAAGDEGARVMRRTRGWERRVGTSWPSLILMALAVLGLTFVAWLYVTDAKEVEDDDLRIATPADLTPTITAPGRLEIFLNSVRPVPSVDVIAKAPWEWETNTMTNWLIENGQALDNLKDLLEEIDWHGRHASWHFTDLGGHANWLAATLLKQVEVAYLQRRGEQEAALAAALDLAELSRRLQDIQAWPSFYFRSLEAHRRCTETLAELLQQSRVSEEVLASFQEQFEACEPHDEHVRTNVLPAFYLHEKKLLLGRQSGEPFDTMPGGEQRARPKRLFFKTNETLGVMAGTVRHLVRQVGQTAASPAGAGEIWSVVPVSEGVGYYQPNGAGMAYASERLKPYLDVPARQQLARTRHLLIVQLFAVRRFVAAEKGLPEKLADLRPRYLAELPQDPFSAEAFHYDAAKGLIYSVGSDLAASGGRPELPPLADPGEPTVKIGVRTAATVR